MRKGHEIAKELTQKNERVVELLEQADGEMTEEVEAAISEIDELQVEAVKKIDAYAYVIDGVEARKSAFEGLKKYFYDKYKKAMAKVKAMDNTIERLKGLILNLMETAEVDKVETSRGKIHIREYEKTHVGELSDEEKTELVDLGFAEWQIKVDKKSILSEFKKDGSKHADYLRLLPIETETTKTIVKL